MYQLRLPLQAPEEETEHPPAPIPHPIACPAPGHPARSGPRLTDPNPCVAQFGPGPAGARCVTCAHLVIKDQRKRWYKCLYRGTAPTPATDHRPRWPACQKYQRKEARP